MGFWQRLWDLVRGKADSALSSLEDPETILDLSIKDAMAEVEKFRKQVGRALVDQKKLQADLQRTASSVEEWTRRAQLAVDAEDDGLAREALVRRAQEETTAREHYVALEQQAQVVAQLKDALRALTVKLEEARRRRNLLVARSRNAEARKKVAETLSGGGSLDRFDEMEAKVQSLELEASATAEMLGEFGSAESDLEKRFKALSPGRDPSVEAALAELKARRLEGSRPALLGPGPAGNRSGPGSGG